MAIASRAVSEMIRATGLTSGLTLEDSAERPEPEGGIGSGVNCHSGDLLQAVESLRVERRFAD